MSEPETVSTAICTIQHMRAVGLCVKGSRVWCQANGIDWNDFVRNGIPAQRLLDTGDPIVKRLADYAIKEQNGG